MKFHSDYGIEEFQRGRLHERARIVAWLTTKTVAYGEQPNLDRLIEAIEAGDHYDDTLPVLQSSEGDHNE